MAKLQTLCETHTTKELIMIAYDNRDRGLVTSVSAWSQIG